MAEVEVQVDGGVGMVGADPKRGGCSINVFPLVTGQGRVTAKRASYFRNAKPI